MLQSAAKPKDTGIRDTVRTIMKEGPLSFWRGNGTNVLKIVPESACKFFAYDMFMRAIVERTEGEVRARERERERERGSESEIVSARDRERE